MEYCVFLAWSVNNTASPLLRPSFHPLICGGETGRDAFTRPESAPSQGPRRCFNYICYQLR